MTYHELKTAIMILQGCIKERQDKIERNQHTEGDTSLESGRLEAECEDIQLAIDHIKGVL